MSDIYAKISVYEIKIGTLNVPLIFHLQIMVMNDIQGELVTTITQIMVMNDSQGDLVSTITQILVRMVI